MLKDALLVSEQGPQEPPGCSQCSCHRVRSTRQAQQAGHRLHRRPAMHLLVHGPPARLHSAHAAALLRKPACRLQHLQADRHCKTQNINVCHLACCGSWESQHAPLRESLPYGRYTREPAAISVRQHDIYVVAAQLCARASPQGGWVVDRQCMHACSFLTARLTCCTWCPWR